MSALRHRLSADASAPALVASLAAAVVVLVGTVTGAGAGQVLLTATVLGVVTAVLAATSARAVRPVPVRVLASGVPDAVPASTAYWCALDAPACPRRPRAPGRR